MGGRQAPDLTVETNMIINKKPMGVVEPSVNQKHTSDRWGDAFINQKKKTRKKTKTHSEMDTKTSFKYIGVGAGSSNAVGCRVP